MERFTRVLTRKLWRFPVFLILIAVFELSIVAVSAFWTALGSPGLAFYVWTDKPMYQPNEAIKIHLRLWNPTLSIPRFTFPTPSQFCYIISDQNGSKVYTDGDVGAFQVETRFSLYPFCWREREFTYSLSNLPLSSGTYFVTGILKGYFSKNVTIEIIEN